MARIQHDIWAHWMKYLFSCCKKVDNSDSVIIPADKVLSWKKQMQTPYDELSAEEKEADREVVRKFFCVLPKDSSVAFKLEPNSLIISE